jgi:hypothetical protein
MLFECHFKVLDINPVGKKFPKVNRFFAYGILNSQITMIFDYPTNNPFSLKQGDQLDVALFEQEPMDKKYDCIMHGQIFQIKKSKLHPGFSNTTMSCGGLLVNIRAATSRFQRFFLDQQVYLAIKKRI